MFTDNSSNYLPFESIVESKTNRGQLVNSYLRDVSHFLPKGVFFQPDYRYDLFRLTDLSNKQLGVIFKMPDRKRLTVQIDSNRDDVFNIT